MPSWAAVGGPEEKVAIKELKMLLHVVLTCLFPLLCNSPACGRTTIYLCGRLLVGIWVASSSGLPCPLCSILLVNTGAHSVVLHLGAQSWVPRRAHSQL